MQRLGAEHLAVGQGVVWRGPASPRVYAGSGFAASIICQHIRSTYNLYNIESLRIYIGYHRAGQLGQLLVHVKLPSKSLRMETLAALRDTTGCFKLHVLHVSSALLLLDRVRRPRRRCASVHCQSVGARVSLMLRGL